VIHADEVSVAGRRGVLLEPTSLTLRIGERHLVAAEPGPGHSALALVLAGRMRPTSGTVTIDGIADPAALRHAVALVDTPGVSEPDDALPVGTVVGEELALAGMSAGPRAVSTWLEGHGVASRHLLFGDLAPLTRTRVLAELAAARPHVHYLVLTLPERHGGDPAGWWALAAELADRDHGVLVQTTTATARVLAAGLTANPHLELM
jgi:energy-coupling factor transporter ATP-binding protein EcfA2